MTILFLMDSPEYLRFYDSAIEELASRGHEVALAVNSGRAKKPVGLEGLQQYADRVRVLGVVPRHEGRWAGVATGVRATMDFVRVLHPRFAGARALRARIKRKVLPRAYHWLDAIPRLSPGIVRVLERGLMTLEQAIPVCEPMVAWLRAEAPDVLLVSPLVAAASEQVDWVKAARVAGIRTAVGIASWDNLTNKGLLRIEPDAVLVWNEAQKREAREYHYIADARITVTGAQLFDRWFDRRVTRDRAAFCRRVGLPDDRPFVLFTGSSSFISESAAEVAFVRRWLGALRAIGDPVLADVNVLVRPHPYNFHRWADAPLAAERGVAVFPRAGYNPVEAENRADFFDSLFHAAAVVGINTSAMIEAAIVGRPVLSMLAPEFAGTQEGTIHFQHLLPEHGGFLRIAATLDEHVTQLADRLRDPASSRAETARFVASFIRPHGIERASTPVFADALERLAAAPAPVPRPAPWWAPLLRPAALALAAPVAIANTLGRRETRNRVRRRVDGAWRRTRKTASRTAGLAAGRMRRWLQTAGKRLSRSLMRIQKARAR
jgi:hypothetical protein